jgi:hypothetical protein
VLTPRKRLFALELLADPELCQWRAAKRAGYRGNERTLTVCASRLMTDVDVRAIVDAALNRKLVKLDAESERILKNVSQMANADVRDLFDRETGASLPIHLLPDGIAAAVVGVDTTSLVGYKLKLADKLRANELLMRYKQLIREPGSDGEPIVVKVLRVTKADLEKQAREEE